MCTQNMADEKSMLKEMKWQDFMKDENVMFCELLFQRRLKTKLERKLSKAVNSFCLLSSFVFPYLW